MKLILKSILFFVFILCFYRHSNAQQYHEFPKSDARWVYHYYSTADEIEERWDFYYISGDTTLNNVTYQKINRKYWLTPFDEPINDINKIYFREIDKKIYFNSTLNPIDDELTYDFNLTVNDTFVTHDGDSLLMIDEYEKFGRRALYFRSINNDYLGLDLFQEWAEGIGSNNCGLTLKGNYRQNLECFKYKECDTCSCYDGIITSNSFLSPINSIKIYPNPTTGIVQLDLNSDDQFLELTSLQGQTILQQNISNNSPENKITLDLSAYPSGIYLLSITSKSGEKNYVKIVKQ